MLDYIKINSFSFQMSLLLPWCLVLALFVQPTPAPVPRCSPMIIINKLAESSNILSDSNPYFPVPPCKRDLDLTLKVH